ncbi:MAG: hypothetical protein E6Q34_08895 [Burkholderiaceae bacterium]|nr:MAG: hypothetical protein E6Q34_08895 [Burkholderiaceae bacterium]
MMLIATWIYLGLSVLVLLFLAALIVGAPWGELTLGGKWRGPLPMKVRLIPLLSIGIIAFFMVIVLARSGLRFPTLSEFSAKGIWIVVAYNVLGVVANSLTPSPRERRLWVPVLIAMLTTSLILAF